MKHLTLALAGAMVLALATPTFAQRTHPRGPPSNPGGRPSEVGPGTNGGSAPSDVLSHNTAIAGKIQALTGQDAQAACAGFKNLGQCVAAAHEAKNLAIPGGFDALKGKVTGSDAVKTYTRRCKPLSP